MQTEFTSTTKLILFIVFQWNWHFPRDIGWKWSNKKIFVCISCLSSVQFDLVCSKEKTNSSVSSYFSFMQRSNSLCAFNIRCIFHDGLWICHANVWKISKMGLSQDSFVWFCVPGISLSIQSKKHSASNSICFLLGRGPRVSRNSKHYGCQILHRTNLQTPSPNHQWNIEPTLWFGWQWIRITETDATKWGKQCFECNYFNNTTWHPDTLKFRPTQRTRCADSTPRTIWMIICISWIGTVD